MRDIKKDQSSKGAKCFESRFVSEGFRSFGTKKRTSCGSNYKHLVPPGLTAYQFLSLIDTRPESGRITLPENVQDWHYMVRTSSH